MQRTAFLTVSCLFWCWAEATYGAGISREAAAHMAAANAAAAATATTTVKANGTSSPGYPAYYYHGQPQPQAAHPGMEVERDPRQWLSAGYGGYGAPFYGGGGLGLGGLGGTDMLLTCLLVVLGIGVIGLPFLLLIFSAFTGGQGGLNFIPPTTTTTVAGRKRRDLHALFPKVNPEAQDKLFGILENFAKSSDKMDYIKKLIEA